MSYEPTVTINGVAVAGSWDGSTLVALDGLTIHWGRTDLFAETEPAQMTVSIIDPTGSWATNNDLIGQPIVVERATPTTKVFRGRVADIDITALKVQNPVTGNYDRVWRTDLQCTDPLTDLAQAIAAGAGLNYVTNIGYVPNGGWAKQNTPALRVAEMFTAGAGEFVDSIQAPALPAAIVGPAPGGGTVARTPGVAYHPEPDHNFLELIERLYKYVALARVSYDPVTHGIVMGMPADNDGMALVLVAGKMTIVPVAGLSIPANTVIMTDEITVNSGVDSAIDAVKFDWYAPALYNTDEKDHWETIQINTTRFSRAQRGRRYLTVASDLDALGGGSYYTTVDSRAIWALNMATALAAVIDEVNGRFSVPEGLRLDLRRFTYDAAVVALALDTKTHTDGIYFPFSILNPLENVGPMFQVIGGTLTWHNAKRGSTLPAGWTHDLQLAPTTGALLNVSMANLVTSSIPTMADFDPLLTMGELGNVTIGLA